MKYDKIDIYKKDNYTVIYTNHKGHCANFWWYYTQEETAKIANNILSEQKDKFKRVESKRWAEHWTGERVEAPLIK